ncbi:hypothetical protein HRbin04_00393 [archaeon HR04]|nr:hypothetical protein HRbin04_00393 [archaeon HR04]
MQDLRERLKSIKNMSDLTYDDIDKYGEKLGMEMYNKELTVTQLRKIHNIILFHKHNIILFHKQKFDKDRLRLIKPLLAYTAAKNPKAKDLCDQLRNLVDKVNNEEDFEKFYRLMESILAYYEYYEKTRSNRQYKKQYYEGWNEDDLR